MEALSRRRNSELVPRKWVEAGAPERSPFWKGFFNTDVVKKQWGFQGIVMSDWTATYDALGAANGGLDLEMPTGDHMNNENLLAAIRDGRVKEATIDEKVRRI